MIAGVIPLSLRNGVGHLIPFPPCLQVGGNCPLCPRLRGLWILPILSFCLSNAGTVSKRIGISSLFLTSRYGASFLIFRAPSPLQNTKGNPSWDNKHKWWEICKYRHFISCLYSSIALYPPGLPRRSDYNWTGLLCWTVFHFHFFSFFKNNYSYFLFWVMR